MPFQRREVPIDTTLKTKIEGAARSIFDVFHSMTTTPPPGAYRLWTGEWINGCATMFPDFYTKLVEYRNNGTIRVVTNAVYESELTTYGETGAFVVDGVNVRLPKITRFISGFDAASELGQVGNSMMQAHQHIGGHWDTDCPGSAIFGKVHMGYNVACDRGDYGSSVWREATSDGTQALPMYNSGGTSLGRNLNAGLAFGNEVKPKHVKLALYIQVYHAAVTQSLADVSTILNEMTKLNARVDAMQQLVNNVTAYNFGAPNHAGRVTLTPEDAATEINYTAPSNGWMWGYYRRKNDGGTLVSIYINGIGYEWSRPGEYHTNSNSSVILPVRKGDKVRIAKESGNWTNSRVTYFIPAVMQ